MMDQISGASGDYITGQQINVNGGVYMQPTREQLR